VATRACNVTCMPIIFGTAMNGQADDESKSATLGGEQEPIA